MTACGSQRDAGNTNAAAIKVGKNSNAGSVVLTATVQMTYDAKALPGTYTASLTVAGALSP